MEYIIFGVDHYNTLGLARSIGKSTGKRCMIICIPSRARGLSKRSIYVRDYIEVDNLEEGYEFLLRHAKEYEGSFLFTMDDKTMSFLDERYDQWKDHYNGFNAGESGRITRYMNKYTILQLAKECGLKILDTVVLNRHDRLPDDLEYPVITKSISPVVGGWKSDVHICHDKKSLEEAMTVIQSDEVLIQKYIEKTNEYCIDGFCAKHGTVMFNGIESNYKYLIPGYYSPYLDVRNFSNPDGIQKPLEDMMRKIGFTGIYSIEFLIYNGEYYFSEINFRNSTWSYASTIAGMNLPYLWMRYTLFGPSMRLSTVEVPDNFTAMVEPIDYNLRVVKGDMKFTDWLKECISTDCKFYYDQDDPHPVAYMLDNLQNFM